MTTINHNVAKRAPRVLEIAKHMAETMSDENERCSVLNRLEDIQLFFNGYSEPGYDVGKSRIIAVSNWNNVDKYVPACDGSTWGSRVDVSDLPSRISKIFEKMGIECEWSDQWIVCDGCNKLVRTDADCYPWQASFIEQDGEVICHECLKADPEDYLSSLEGNYRKCNTISDISPKDFGYVLVEQCASGWYDRNDNPKEVAKKVEQKGVERYLFNVDDVSQFETSFSLWVHESELDLIQD